MNTESNIVPKDRIIVALDTDTPSEALRLVKLLHEYVGGFKVGLEFITAMFAQLIGTERIEDAYTMVGKIRGLYKMLDGRLFHDGKFDDIPNTVGKATKALKPLRIRMFTVHASAGPEAMRRAIANKGDSLAIAVGVLSSYEENDAHLTFGKPVKAAMLQFARYAVSAKFDGMIVAPEELAFLRSNDEFAGLIKIATGIRSKNSPPDDQERTMTAADAIKAGADYLVIGRPITEAEDPVEEVRLLIHEISDALE